MKKIVYIIIFIGFTSCMLGQKSTFDFKGQLSGITSFSPDNDLDWFLGGRYIPEVCYNIPLDSIHALDFNVALNVDGSVLFHPFNASETQGNIDPYRVWARYTSKQFEIRLGLQKIDFGVATLLRPLQWFNQIDPRDPLQLTNGVYGALARYYFLNNANIWLWSLLKNKKTRGFEVLKTDKNIPEFGGRFQYPVSKGEMAFSYHHRNTNSTHIFGIQPYEHIKENRFGLDGKWDVTVGLWFEATHTVKNKDLGILTNQSLFNLGTDYTFGLGNGLNMVAEHLISSFDQDAFDFKNIKNTTAVSVSYPLNFFNTIRTMYYYNWDTKDGSAFVSYEHQFKKLSGYVMFYYNPETQQDIQDNELTTNFVGPGIRLMLVYNY